MRVDDIFVNSLSETIASHRLIEHGRPVIVAVSGGADSVALLAALSMLGYDCVAAHCNYHLRGEESNRDMRHVQSICSQLGVDLYVRDFDVSERRKATGESIEMACRELRYAWFSELLDKQRAQAIVVAHHKEDNIETFFLNLIRGSGICGLTGMRRRNGYVVRPLLDFSRGQIEDFLSRIGMGYVTDSSNLSNYYSRNKLRNVILPALEAQFPGAAEGVLASISHLADNRLLYEWCVEEKTKEFFSDHKIDVRRLEREAGDRAPILLFEMIRRYGFNMSQVADILGSDGKSGLVFAGKEAALFLDRGILTLKSSSVAGIKDEVWTISLRRDVLSPVRILISEHPITDFKPERNPCVAYFDTEILSASRTFEIRHWRRGDRMAPFGMDGTKLLSDIFAAAKYGAEDKGNAWILTADGEIVWVVGLRASSRWSVVPQTRRYLRLEYRN